MKSKMIFLLGACLAAGLGVTAAQSIETEVAGRVIFAPIFDNSYRLLFSQNTTTLGTARSAAMGGAFASLGADLSSININPAGLGMYQSSQWGVTAALSANSMRTAAPNMPAGSFTSGGNRVSFGLNNVGAVFNAFNRSGRFTSLSFGFSYNRVANFNSRSEHSTSGERTSITELMREQLSSMSTAGKNPIGPGDLAPSEDPFRNENIFLTEWGSLLGWQTGLVRADPATHTYESLKGVTPASSHFSTTTRGGMYEYAVSMGANISNVFYWGVTLGATQLVYRESSTYRETWSGGEASGMRYDYSKHMSGAGVMAKFGIAVRPVPALRIGVAFHTPTAFSIDKSYTSSMEGLARANSGDPLVERQHFSTSPWLLVGISGVVASRAVVALDWECAFHNAIRAREMHPDDLDFIRREVGESYSPAQTLRAGFEVMATDNISLRAGGGYRWDFMKQSTRGTIFHNPTPTSGYNVTAGIGFKVGRRGYIDVAYVFNHLNYTNYQLFLFERKTYDGAGQLLDTTTWSQYDTANGVDIARRYTPRRNHHLLSVTLGGRF